MSETKESDTLAADGKKDGKNEPIFYATVEGDKAKTGKFVKPRVRRVFDCCWSWGCQHRKNSSLALPCFVVLQRRVLEPLPLFDEDSLYDWCVRLVALLALPCRLSLERSVKVH
jgi:hypothetical protein